MFCLKVIATIDAFSSFLNIQAINKCKTAKRYLNTPTFIGYTHSHSTKHQWTLETQNSAF